MALQDPQKDVPFGNYAPIQNTPAAQQAMDHNSHNYEEVLGETNALSTGNFSEHSAPDLDLKTNSNTQTPLDYANAKWTGSWQGPTSMIAPAVCGFLLALGHHTYYTTLDNQDTRSTARQQWALRIGNTFAFLIVALLKIACDAAYSQYIWTIFRKKSLPIKSIDALFSLTTNFGNFFSSHLLRSSITAVFLGLIPWLMAFAGLAPPATLSIIFGNHTGIQNHTMMSLNWTSLSFFDGQVQMGGPSTQVLNLATQAAQNMAIIPIAPPFPNSSFSIQFHGPSVKCLLPNSSQQSSFDIYSITLSNISTNGNGHTFYNPMLTQSTVETFNATMNAQVGGYGMEPPRMLILSAFAPFENPSTYFQVPTDNGWFDSMPSLDGIDQFNNWNTTIPLEEYDIARSWFQNAEYSSGDVGKPPYITQQLWVITSAQSLVCTMGNALFNVHFEFVNGEQTLSRYQTSDFEPMYVPVFPSPSIFGNATYAPASLPMRTYMSVFTAFTSLLSGNITTFLNFESSPTTGKTTGSITQFSDSSSKVLQNGLRGCDEIIDNWFNNNHITNGGFPPIYIYHPPMAEPLTDDLFDNNTSWMCRNHTLMHAIEDLMNNITISMLSDLDLTSNNSTAIPITVHTIRNIYHYGARNLLISYGIAILSTVFSISFGLYSFHINGVTYSSDFSALIATTRNPDLHFLSQGNSLGDLHGNKKIRKIKLRFGVLADDEKDITDGKARDKRVGFGLENRVTGLKRGI